MMKNCLISYYTFGKNESAIGKNKSAINIAIDINSLEKQESYYNRAWAMFLHHIMSSKENPDMIQMDQIRIGEFDPKSPIISDISREEKIEALSNFELQDTIINPEVFEELFVIR